jgi:photosystem II stability/assembly factor-like uncharacterized protein
MWTTPWDTCHRLKIVSRVMEALRHPFQRAIVCLSIAAMFGLFAAGSDAAGPKKFKAIFEPVNYTEDLNLTDVHFVSADVGWVTGTAGTILHTTDGGKTWNAQLGGDPKAADRPIRYLRFLGGTQGWAVQSTGVGDHKLLHTSDGLNWEAAGTVGQHRSDYLFTTPTTGFYTSKDKIFKTSDGGVSWQPVFACAMKLEVKGLTREVRCDPSKLAFPGSDLGYAVSKSLDGKTGFPVLKTVDGGATWKSIAVLPGEDAREGALIFTDEKTGLLRVGGGKLFRTTDGGLSWTGVAGQAPGGKPEIKFAGPVGWMCHYKTLTYTTDGGRHWSSREIKFPGSVEAFSLPQPDRGYVVGDHGMVYRYRIVPADYSVKGMLDAPMMIRPE